MTFALALLALGVLSGSELREQPDPDLTLTLVCDQPELLVGEMLDLLVEIRNNTCEKQYLPISGVDCQGLSVFARGSEPAELRLGSRYPASHPHLVCAPTQGAIQLWVPLSGPTGLVSAGDFEIHVELASKSGTEIPTSPDTVPGPEPTPASTTISLGGNFVSNTIHVHVTLPADPDELQARAEVREGQRMCVNMIYNWKDQYTVMASLESMSRADGKPVDAILARRQELIEQSASAVARSLREYPCTPWSDDVELAGVFSPGSTSEGIRAGLSEVARHRRGTTAAAQARLMLEQFEHLERIPRWGSSQTPGRFPITRAR
jgi:hypothetical protein